MPHRKKVVGPDSFSTLDVCKICNILRERLRDWINREYITPSSYITEGARHIAVFDTQKVISVMLFKLLVDEGYNRDYASILLYDLEYRSKTNIMKEYYIQLSSEEDSIIYTTIALDNPRKAVLRGIERLRR